MYHGYAWSTESQNFLQWKSGGKKEEHNIELKLNLLWPVLHSKRSRVT